MIRTLLAGLALLLLTAAAHSDTPPSPDRHNAVFSHARTQNPTLRMLTSPAPGHSTPVALSCCKVCSVGKACGNTCISRDKTCHVGPGCACDG